MSGLRLRPEQQRVIDEYRHGYAAVSSVPGAGKTTTLSALAASLIEDHVFARQRVVVVTYQNAAVANFQAAISERLRERGLPERGFIVRTLHGLANDVLQVAGRRVNLAADVAVIDDYEAEQLLTECIEAGIKHHQEMLHELVVYPDLPAARFWPDRWVLHDVVREAVRELKQRPVDYEDLQARLHGDERWLPFILDVCRAYDEALRERGMVDFDDIICRAVEALEQDDLLCNRLRAHWPYLLEDEAQDSTPLQERMLLRIAGPDGNLVRVGDANQAILTSFTASDVRGFRRWLARDDVQQFELRGSSRSTAAILELANRFVRQVRNEHPVEEARRESLDDQPIEPVPPENPDLPSGGTRTGVTVKTFDTTDQEREEVIRRAIGHLQRNPEDRVAVLVGGREAGYQFAQSAIRRGFPSERLIRMLGGRDGRPIHLVDRLLPVLDYLAEPDVGFRLARMLEAWSPLGRDDTVARIAGRLGPDTDPSLEDVFTSATLEVLRDALGLGNLSAEEEQSILRLQAVPLWLAGRLAPPHELLSLLAATLQPDAEERALLNRMISGVQSIQPDSAVDRLTALRRYLNDLKSRRRQLRGTPEEFMIRIDPGTLTVSTRHQAKGLEWDIVFAVGCDDFWFPGSLDIRRMSHRDYLGPADPVITTRTELRALLDGQSTSPGQDAVLTAMNADAREQIAERLRVMYVTITRARRGLWVSWHRQGYTAADRPVPRVESPLLPMLDAIATEIQRSLNE